MPPTVFAASFTASSGVIPVLMRTAEKFRIMLSTAAFTFFCSSCVFCSGRFLFASVSFSKVELSTGSAPSDLSGLLHSSENVVSTLIVSSDFLPCTTSAYTVSKSSRTSFPLVLIVSRSRSRFRMALLNSSFLCSGTA